MQDIRPTRVSAKIQQLLNTLKRPKRRPLNEYFEDNQEEVASKCLKYSPFGGGGIWLAQLVLIWNAKINGSEHGHTNE